METDDATRWFERRRAFWQQVAPDLPPAANDTLLDQLSNATRSSGLTLWLGTGADEQMLAAWLAAFLRCDGAAPVVSVVQLHHLPGGRTGTWEARSLSVLREKEFMGVPAPVQLSMADLELYDAAWRAVTSPTPDGLMAFIDEGRDAPHVVGRALRDLLNRYPEASNGLNSWERLVLEHLRSDGPDLAMAIASTVADSMDGLDWISDTWLQWRVRRLANPTQPHPLVEIERGEADGAPQRAVLTKPGSLVLDGKASAIRLNGLDDWVGGVHLKHPGGTLWLKSGTRLVSGNELA